MYTTTCMHACISLILYSDMYSGVASYGHWIGPLSSFGNYVYYAASASLTVRISKITKEKYILQFSLSRQKHAKTHVNRLK